jgi:hypothetical protein
VSEEVPQNPTENVIEFKVHKEPGNLTLKPTDYFECMHRQLVLDVEGRLIQCKTCNKALDPWKALKVIQKWFSERDYKWERIKEEEKRETERRQKKRDRYLREKGLV